MPPVLQDLKYAIRTFARNPGFTAVAIATLAVGIGASTAMFSAMNTLLLRPLPFPDPDRWPPRLPIFRPGGPPASIRSRPFEANEVRP